MPTVYRFAGLPEVRCRGEALGSPVYWLGLQWAVTADGVEMRDGTYVIERGRVHEVSGDWTWEKQIGEKGWADMDDFRAAMAFARKKWPKTKPAPRGTADKLPARPHRLGKLLACTDTICGSTHAIMGQVWSLRGSAFVEVGRNGRAGLKHLPAEQTFAVDVRELRGLIQILRQAEASAVRHGLLEALN